MPEPGYGSSSTSSTSSSSKSRSGASSSSSSDSNASSSSSSSSSISSSKTTAESLSSSKTSVDSLTSGSSKADSNTPTTTESLTNTPTTAETLSSSSTHSYDEVPSVAVSKYEPPAASKSNTNESTKSESTASVPATDLPAGVTRETAGLLGLSVHPVGGVDAVWANKDGTYSSSDGTTYDPATGKGTYDAGEDSFAVTSKTNVTVLEATISSNGTTLDTKNIESIARERHPDRVRSSESLALVEHDPKGLAKAHGNRVAFDYYNNPNIDSIRQEALMHASNRAGVEVGGRFPGENLAYIGIAPLAMHLTRSYGLSSPLPNVQQAPRNVTVYRVDTNGFPARISTEGAIPVVTTRRGKERALFINIDQPGRAKDFAQTNRNGDSTITAVEADASLLQTLRTQSVYDKSNEASTNPTAPIVVDVNQAPNQFGLRTPEQIQMLRDKIYPSTTRTVNPNDL